jgi:hypothetical protein
VDRTVYTPPSNTSFGALTMASTASVVTSATQTSRGRSYLNGKQRRRIWYGKNLSRRELITLRAYHAHSQVHRTLQPDIVEVFVEEAPE